jgi:hypothetical protein
MNPIPTRCCICGLESVEGSVRVKCVSPHCKDDAWRYQIKSIGTNALKWVAENEVTLSIVH